MQQTYFHYHLKKHGEKARFSCDLRPLLRGFCRWNAPAFKRRFTHNGESLLLVHVHDDVFLFLQTRDRETIKKIQRQPLAIDDIHTVLRNNESIGFASYVLFREDYFGIATKVLSPRATAFHDFVNTLLSGLGLAYSFETKALATQMQRTQIANLRRVGRVAIKLGRGHTMLGTLLGNFGADPGPEETDVGSIEVIIKPNKRKGDIKPVLAAISASVGEEGIEAFDARVVTELTDKATDAYFVGEGAIRDVVTEKDEGKLIVRLGTLADENRALQAKLTRERGNHAPRPLGDPAVERLCQPGAWTNRADPDAE